MAKASGLFVDSIGSNLDSKRATASSRFGWSCSKYQFPVTERGTIFVARRDTRGSNLSVLNVGS